MEKKVSNDEILAAALSLIVTSNILSLEDIINAKKKEIGMFLI